MKSVWSETALPTFPQLSESIKTDVLIIGGGIAGILTAYFLQEVGISYVLVEKGRICSGNTCNTTAKITVQHGLIYDKLLKSCGLETAKTYLEANDAAFRRFAALCKKFPCDFSYRDNYVYSFSQKKLEQELSALQKIGSRAEFCHDLPLPLRPAGAVKFPQQAQFHPLKLMAALAAGLRIYESTPVTEMVGSTAVTPFGNIRADRVVCATHFPFINKHGLYFLKLYQHRSYVIALEHAQEVGGMYADENESGLSFRNYGELLLLGGGGGRTGKENESWEMLRRFARMHYPNAQEKAFWAAQDCMSLDRIPYIGQYAKGTPDFYVETGFNKWGMTSAMLSAILITDALLGRKNAYAEIFHPSRRILRPQLFLNGAETIKSLLTPSKKVCPHMGCALQWNKAEHSWDCPCHGSRFSEDGTLLENPATGDLKKDGS